MLPGNMSATRHFCRCRNPDYNCCGWWIQAMACQLSEHSWHVQQGQALTQVCHGVWRLAQSSSRAHPAQGHHEVSTDTKPIFYTEASCALNLHWGSSPHSQYLLWGSSLHSQFVETPARD